MLDVVDSNVESYFNQGGLVSGRYQFDCFIGAGGMGWVIKAKDRVLKDQHVALKLLYPHLVREKTSLVRLKNEVLIARKLVHPNILRTFNFGTCKYVGHYIVMEYVQGSNLKELLLKQPTPGFAFDSVVRLLYRVSISIGYAHQRSIIHRDLKPDNVLLSDSNEVKLGDFGLAQGAWQDTEAAGAGKVLGTPYYMAPEQFRSEQTDHRTDIYALGIMAFELLTGSVPFDDDSLYNLAQMHFSQPLPDIKQYLDDVPQWMMLLLSKCTAKNMGDRFQTIEEVSALLAAHLPVEELQEPATQVIISDSDYGDGFVTRWGGGYIVKKMVIPRVQIIVGLCVVAFCIYFVNTNPWTRSQLSIVFCYLELKTGLNFGIEKYVFGIDANSQETLGSAFDNGLKNINVLLRAGVDPDVPGQDGRFILDKAAQSSLVDLVERLLKHGASPNRINRWGFAAIHYVTGLEGCEIAKMLQKYGGDLNIRTVQGNSALMEVIKRRDYRLTRCLLVLGVDPLVENYEGWSALKLAVISGKVYLVQAVLSFHPPLEGKTLESINSIIPTENVETIRQILKSHEAK